MALELQNPVIVPDTYYLPMVMIQTVLVDGKPRMVWHITLAAAQTQADGTLVATGQSAGIPLSSDDPQPEVQAVLPQMAQAQEQVAKIAAVLNEARKVL